MTGPQYPRTPLPGSNAIGSFVIGVSPIGDIPAFDPYATVLSQYANSPILTSLIESFNSAMDQTRNYNELFDFVWNVVTARGAGLDVWGRIVGVQRVLTISTDTFFGFEQQQPTVDTFGPNSQGTFYSGTPSTDNFSLSDTAFRQLIFAKAMANITNGSIASLNRILMNLFPNRGNCYVVDDGGMTMTYRFEFILSPLEQAIVSQSGVLPRPVGVAATIVQG